MLPQGPPQRGRRGAPRNPIMRVHAPTGGSFYTATSARRSAGAGFRVAADEATGPTSASAPPMAAASLDALVALQGIDDPRDRRRRAVRRGSSTLDALDALKLGVLSGQLDTAALDRLKSASVGLAGASGDPRLDGVLAEIELRAAVELAKLGTR